MKEADFYQLALQQRIREAANSSATDSTDYAIEIIDGMNESGATCSDEVTSDKDEWEEELCVRGVWCIDKQNDEMVPKLAYDGLKIRLDESRDCNERLTMERLNLLDAIKNVTLSAKLSTLSEEAKYELAAIPGSPSHDVRFITAGILILYARNSTDIRNLSKSGRCAGKSSGKKIDPEKYLKLKNLFSARVRKNVKTLAEGDDRINLFESLLVRAITGAKKKM